MCGVAGILRRTAKRRPSRAPLERMAAAQRHRGPDGWGLYRDAHCGLVHDRLAIIDLAQGAQPLCNEDGTLWISFNGEIFNYVELREELVRLGHGFRTRSDTEVIVHAFEQWGTGCFDRFNGQWALALWDAERRRLVLSRDRLGVRPLHLCEHDGLLFFASEVKALFAADPAIPRALDPAGLTETFTFWSPVPPRTPFVGVTELEPGTVRIFDADGRDTRQDYWRHRFPLDGGRTGTFQGTIDEGAAAVRRVLGEATRLRLTRSDVPVGSYLSGGLDSSLVAALAAEVARERFCTFSIRFEDAEYDETAWQRLMVQRLGTDHHELVVRRADVAGALPRVVLHAERPLLRAAPAPLALLSGLVHDTGIKVVLTGEGADEVFAGYDLFREAKVRRFWARHPGSQLRPRLLERLYPYLARSPTAQRALSRKFFGRELARASEPGFSHGLRWDSAAALQRLFTPDLRETARGLDVRSALLADLPADFPRWAPLAQDQYLEMRTLLAGYLLSSQGDRMLMASSVEGRFPFLDRDVVELAASLPSHWKLWVLDEKHLLKRAAAGLVPDEIVKRTKQPYRAPDALSFCGPGAPGWVEELLSPSMIQAAGVFDPGAVSALHAKCRAHAGDEQLSNSDNMGLVGVLSTQLLWEHLVRSSPTPERLPPGLVIDHVDPVGAEGEP